MFETFKGKISYISDVLHEETRTLTVRTEVENKGYRLKPGMFANINIFLNHQSKALVLPEEALLDDKEDKIIFIQRDAKYYPQVVVTVKDGRGVELGELERIILESFPRTSGTDDAWDEEGFEGTYGQASEALDGWLMTVTVVMMIMLIAGVSDTMLVTVPE